MNTIIEPFRIKMVEPLRLTTPAEREEVLRRAHFNMFQILADDQCLSTPRIATRFEDPRSSTDAASLHRQVR